ncbi:uncharacterized protein LOC135844502 [Planococcus citri]|uniref:uncharacterized protein LOC135844502 n=1 Tax=Planococcus citri TaxID=170843 RepID=UPI0031F7B788
MNVKLFSHLLMAHLLSDWWRVFGRCANLKLEEEDLEVLKLLVTKSDLHQVMREHLISVRSGLNSKISLLEEKASKEQRKREDIEQELRSNLKAVYRIKLRDWIVEAERDFPLWLSDLDINRFIKWVLALNFAQEPIFDDLRRFLKENAITIEKFANEMYFIHEEMSEKFAHELPGIADPTPDIIPQVCKIVAGLINERRQLICSVLLQAIFVGTEDAPSTSVQTPLTPPDPYPTKFYIIIRNIKKGVEQGELLTLDKFTKKIQQNSEFNTKKCAILENFIINQSKLDNTPFSKMNELNLPTIVIRIGFPKTYRGLSADDFAKTLSELDFLKKSINDDIKTLDSDALILNPTEFISHKWFRSG